jgi:hypothetical protein
MNVGMDVVKKLRERVPCGQVGCAERFLCPTCFWLRLAADEIEELRAEIKILQNLHGLKEIVPSDRV